LDTADVRGLLGVLLADGSLRAYRSPTGGYIQLTLTAGLQQSAFLEEKTAEVRQFLPNQAAIVPYRTVQRANGKRTTVLRYRVSSARLRPVYNLLYPSAQRCITSQVLELLGARAAAWLWAEGARPAADGSAVATRVGRTPAEAQRVADWLATLCGPRAELIDSHCQPRLHFQPDQAAVVRQALAPYAPTSRHHLFTAEHWNVSTIRSARTELLLGQRSPEPAGAAAASLAGAAAS
jgi:hypothetical protein